MSDDRRPGLSPALLDLARRAGDGALPPAAARLARRRLEDALAGRTPRRRAPWLLGAGVAAAAATAALLLAARPLRYEVSGAARLATDEWVQTSDEGAGRLAFSDGTRVDVAPGTSLRIAHVNVRGADLVQERGRAFYAVTRRPAGAWRVAAGPYQVTVTGTRFAVSWAPERGEFVTELHEGSVVIAGPAATQGIALHAGQRFRALASGGIAIEPLAPRAPDVAEAPSALPATAGAPSAQPVALETAPLASSAALSALPSTSTAVSPGASPLVAASVAPAPFPSAAAAPFPSAAAAPFSSAAPAPFSSAAPPRPDAAVSASALPAVRAATLPPLPPRALSERVISGEAAAIVAEVEREGLDAVAARSSPAELVTVADAARYARKPALALAALRLVRARHRGTREAVLAAFHLGRIDDDEGRPGAALVWYDAYLKESGGAGPFAPEVRGRQMLATARVAGPAAARALAAEYLRLYPEGPYASRASALVSSP
ncbi:MAG: FecR family protein [Polyangiaceae bacterium]|nr:FecR family protein [Polyangiaceae bacterium]